MPTRRNALLVLTLLMVPAVSAADVWDAPAGYYDAVTGTGGVLESRLRSRMSSGQISRSYDDFRDLAVITDADPARPGNILLTYTGESVSGAWDSGRTWNREHVWPQSRQPSGQNRRDPHALRPTDPGENGSRGNRPFGGVAATGSARVLADGSYFPGGPDRGDVARSLFYSSTRYGLDLVRGTPSGDEMGDLDALLAWHYLDVPDDFERRRNHAVYSQSLNPSNYTDNRNAYVDRPELVWSVFVDQMNDSRLVMTSPTLRTETVYRGATPAGGAVDVLREGVDPTYFTVIGGGLLELSGGDVRDAVGAASLDASNRSYGYAVAAGATTSAGVFSGSVTVDNLDVTTQGGTGRGANDADDVFDYELTVLDHATPSLAGPGVVLADGLDAGIIGLGLGPATFEVPVYNLNGTAGFTADLLAGPVSSSDGRVTAGAFDAVAGGGSETVTVTVSPDALGMLSATVTLGTAEPAFAGAQNLASLSVGVTGRVATPGDANLDGDVDVFRFDGGGDAQILTSNLGTLSGATWTDGNFNGDGDVDVFQFDGLGDAQLLTSNLGFPGTAASRAAVASGEEGDVSAMTASGTYDPATGAVVVEIGTGVGVVGLESLAGGTLVPTNLTDALAASQATADTIAFFGAGGLPAGEYDLGFIVRPGILVEDLGFGYTPIGGDFTATGLVVVPEPTALAVLGIGGLAAMTRRRHAA